MNLNTKVVIFDLDETLGYFTELGIFCDCLNNYYDSKNYSNIYFNEILDLFSEFLRPKIIKILEYLVLKKKQNKCAKVMIYTNNQGLKSWSNNIKEYFDYKLKYKLFDQVIAAFKVNGKKVEMNRTTHDKTVNDFVKCTKLPKDIEICFIDDQYHPQMHDDNVYYIYIKPYHYDIFFDDMIQRYLKSNLGSKIKNVNDFIVSMKNHYNLYNYSFIPKTKEEYEIDEIVGKKILEHLKIFFKELSYNKTIKNKKIKKSLKKNKTLKNS